MGYLPTDTGNPWEETHKDVGVGVADCQPAGNGYGCICGSLVRLPK